MRSEILQTCELIGPHDAGAVLNRNVVIVAANDDFLGPLRAIMCAGKQQQVVVVIKLNCS